MLPAASHQNCQQQSDDSSIHGQLSEQPAVQGCLACKVLFCKQGRREQELWLVVCGRGGGLPQLWAGEAGTEQQGERRAELAPLVPLQKAHQRVLGTRAGLQELLHSLTVPPASSFAECGV